MGTAHWAVSVHFITIDYSLTTLDNCQRGIHQLYQ